jgi:tRNA pseudouridine38-40 synthase
MRNIKLTIQYDGARYKGWQRLKDPDKTIQGKLEQVISKMTETETEVIGSGRTDAGVHAFRQTANFKTDDLRSLEDIKEYLNLYLPSDIAVTNVAEVPERFHSRHNVISKTYLYRIWNLSHPEPFLRKYSYHIRGPHLKVKAMRKAAEYLIGEHDFTSFRSSSAKNKTAVRTIKDIRFEKNDGMLEIFVEGDGFLYNMVRIIIGTLLEVGLGNINAEEIPSILASCDRTKAGPTAPPHGLFLYDVKYPE